MIDSSSTSPRLRHKPLRRRRIHLVAPPPSPLKQHHSHLTRSQRRSAPAEYVAASSTSTRWQDGRRRRRGVPLVDAAAALHIVDVADSSNSHAPIGEGPTSPPPPTRTAYTEPPRRHLLAGNFLR
jgi:hypothetical protein